MSPRTSIVWQNIEIFNDIDVAFKLTFNRCDENDKVVNEFYQRCFGREL